MRLLHIFRKDVRHFLPEILVSLAVLVGFAWSAPYSWGESYVPDMFHLASGILRLLLPLSWLLLISRLIHEEALVGDRQFWITRPYDWATLLAEKVLFIVLFLHVPLFLMQCFLLHKAGLAVAPALGALLYYQASVAVIYVLPFTALAAVTTSFGVQLLAGLTAILYLVLVRGFTGWLTQRQMPPPYGDAVVLAAVVLTLVAVVLAMYARRPVNKARLALVCLPVAAALLAFALPTRFLVRRVYADTAGNHVITFRADPSRRAPAKGDLLQVEHTVRVSLPVQLHASRNEEATVKGVSVFLRASDGWSWTSGMQSADDVLHADSVGSLDVFLPYDVYQRLLSQSVTLRVEVLVERFRFPAPEIVTVPAKGRFMLANGGSCASLTANDFLQCRYAIRKPPPVSIALELQREPCGDRGQQQWVHRRTDGALEGHSLDFDPVSMQVVPLALEEGEPPTIVERQLCPGSHASFSTEQSEGKERLWLDVPSISLPLYAVHRVGMTRSQIRMTSRP